MREMNLQKFIPEIKKNILLKKYTTFKIGGPARYFFVARNNKELTKALKLAKKFKIPFFILGGGSNLLVSEKGYNGLVIKIQNTGCEIKNLNSVYITAGEKLNSLVNFSFKNSLTGLEWAAGIPGTVGGAIYGNAGAFGSFMADSIKRVEVLDSKTLKIKNLSKKDCKFGNKNSIFKRRKSLIILAADFQLKKGDKKEIGKKIKEYSNYRRKNHPLDFPSAGCVFKNFKVKIKNPELLKEFPELKEFNKKGVIPTAYLIDKCGLKGKKIGGAEVSKKHANFVINSRGAEAPDVVKLKNLIKKKIKEKFKVTPEEEIQYLGF